MTSKKKKYRGIYFGIYMVSYFLFFYIKWKVCLSICMSVCLYVCLSICLSVFDAFPEVKGYSYEILICYKGSDCTTNGHITGYRSGAFCVEKNYKL